jgi:hypothetical protein
MARATTRTETCSLTLTIAGVDYRLRPVSAGWRLRKAGSDELYLVVEAGDGASCDCGDARFRGRRCKHVRALVALGLVR